MRSPMSGATTTAVLLLAFAARAQPAAPADGATTGPPSREARHGIEQCVYEPLAARNGSVSAEHGIGLEKRPWLPLSRSPVELDLMRRLKAALDPKNILNPGRVLPD